MKQRPYVGNVAVTEKLVACWFKLVDAERRQTFNQARQSPQPLRPNELWFSSPQLTKNVKWLP